MSKLGIIIVDHGSKVPASNAMFEGFVREFQEEFELPIVEAAHMELATPGIHDAFGRCIDQGADSIIVVPYFFFSGRHLQVDVPHMCAAAAKYYDEISFKIAQPLGLHPLMKSIVADRIEENLSSDPEPYSKTPDTIV